MCSSTSTNGSSASNRPSSTSTAASTTPKSLTRRPVPGPARGVRGEPARDRRVDPRWDEGDRRFCRHNPGARRPRRAGADEGRIRAARRKHRAVQRHRPQGHGRARGADQRPPRGGRGRRHPSPADGERWHPFPARGPSQCFSPGSCRLEQPRQTPARRSGCGCGGMCGTSGARGPPTARSGS